MVEEVIVPGSGRDEGGVECLRLVKGVYIGRKRARERKVSAREKGENEGTYR